MISDSWCLHGVRFGMVCRCLPSIASLTSGWEHQGPCASSGMLGKLVLTQNFGMRSDPRCLSQCRSTDRLA